ncbi:16S rRNA (guanine(527)-N(7))-methyltransferase RsmG [Balneatrix alpica]|uniref:Ribosomal RNA small subunit methyltransferase G n=1 Tax=Balneatrix alpica TaxID=75684 RepID=A0ABV5ZB78_9GAMM|nr:16S rRNA (guanine(527)-N(7))-methyltransferase RsmG [Balneatrix alpica]
MSYATELATGLTALKVVASAEQQQQLLDYLDLLIKWNQAYNLTAVRDPREMVSRHLLDSLSVHPYLQGQRLIDVGTGAGLPGIPLAILNPDKAFSLLDSNGKRTRFLTQVKMTLGLQNVEVLNTRVESWQPPQPFDTVLSRAFASMQDMVKVTSHLLKPGGLFMAMKGLYPEQEIAALPASLQLEQALALQVPGCEAERHLVIVRQP